MVEILLYYVAPFVFGACVGSFLNVCIYRIPLDRSVVTPGSHCASCGTPLRWYQNIPILSWFLLKGKCKRCGIRIDWRYPLVEGITAVLFLALWLRYPPMQALVFAVLVAGLIVGTFIDIDHFILPDRVTLGGCVVGVVLSVLVPELHGVSDRLAALWASLIGLAFGGGMLLAVAVGGSLIFRKEAMGFGDVKLMAAFGAFFGWEAPLFILVVASMIGSIYGIGIMFLRNKTWGTPIPFGPFLVLGAIIWLFGGNLQVHAYFARFG